MLNEGSEQNTVLISSERHHVPKGKLNTANGERVNVGKIIASGGNGTVCEIEGNENAVIKFIKPDGMFVDDPHQWAKEEYEAIKARNAEPEGESIVTAYDLVVDEEQKPVGYTMERIDGQPILKYSRANGYDGPPLPKGAFKRFQENILALARKGLPHGELTSENVYVLQDQNGTRFIATEPRPSFKWPEEATGIREDNAALNMLKKVYDIPFQ